ncbi:MAG: carbon starvation CstA family protein [Verrucomicrobiales bacterium]
MLPVWRTLLSGGTTSTRCPPARWRWSSSAVAASSLHRQGAAAGDARAALEIVAPAFRTGGRRPGGRADDLPVLFITIACGAVSGFHCLVSSGGSKQPVRAQRPCRAARSDRSFLAVLVILACVAGSAGRSAADGTVVAGRTPTPRATPRGAQRGARREGRRIRRGIGEFPRGAWTRPGIRHRHVGVFNRLNRAPRTPPRLQRYVIQELVASSRPRSRPARSPSNLGLDDNQRGALPIPGRYKQGRPRLPPGGQQTRCHPSSPSSSPG